MDGVFSMPSGIVVADGLHMGMLPEIGGALVVDAVDLRETVSTPDQHLAMGEMFAAEQSVTQSVLKVQVPRWDRTRCDL